MGPLALGLTPLPAATCPRVSPLCACVCVCVHSLSRVQLFVTLWMVAHQFPLSMAFFRQEYWSGFPLHTPGDLPDPRVELMSLAFPALAGGFFTSAPPGKPESHLYVSLTGGSDGKESACNAGDPRSIPVLGRSPAGGYGNPLQYSCLENSHGRRNLAGYSRWGHKESDTTSD